MKEWITNGTMEILNKCKPEGGAIIGNPQETKVHSVKELINMGIYGLWRK